MPSKIFNWVTGRVSGLRLHDLNCGLKAYRAEVVQGLRLYGELHRFIPVLAHYRGYRVAELRSTTGRASSAAPVTASSGTSAASSTCSRSRSSAATATGRCTFSAGSASPLGAIGFACSST